MNSKLLDTLLYPSHDQVIVSVYMQVHTTLASNHQLCTSLDISTFVKVAQTDTTWVCIDICCTSVGWLLAYNITNPQHPTSAQEYNNSQILDCVFIVFNYCHSHIWMYTSVVGVLWSISRIFWGRDDARSTVFHHFHMKLASSNLLRLAALLGSNNCTTT